MMFDYATLHPAYGRMFAIQYKVGLADDEKEPILQKMAEYVSSLWAILDNELAQKQFITGDSPSIADYLAAVYSSWGKNFPTIPIVLGENVKRMIYAVVITSYSIHYTKLYEKWRPGGRAKTLSIWEWEIRIWRPRSTSSIN